MTKEKYTEWLNNIMVSNNLEGGFIHSSFSNGIDNEDLTPCYVDSRVKGSRKIKKELAFLIDAYLAEYPNAKRPLYSYN